MRRATLRDLAGRAPVALVLAAAVSAMAAVPVAASPSTQCTVNGVAPEPGSQGVTGTAGDDVIVCTGSVAFRIAGGAGLDEITIDGNLVAGGLVLGGADRDTIKVNGATGWYWYRAQQGAAARLASVPGCQRACS